MDTARALVAGAMGIDVALATGGAAIAVSTSGRRIVRPTLPALGVTLTVAVGVAAYVVAWIGARA